MNKTKLNEYLDIAKKLIAKDGNLTPVVFLDVAKSEKPIILGLPGISSEQIRRQFMFFKLGAEIKLAKKEVNGITFLSEAWYTKSEENKKNLVRPSDNPNRKEAIVILSSNIKGKYNFLIQPFKMEGKEVVFEKENKKTKTDKKDKAGTIEDNILKWFWRGYEAAIKIEKERAVENKN